MDSSLPLEGQCITCRIVVNSEVHAHDVDNNLEDGYQFSIILRMYRGTGGR